MKRKLFPLILCLALLAGCGETVPAEQADPEAVATTLPESVSYDTPAESDMFSNRDFETDYTSYVSITLSENTVSAGSGVSVSGSTAIITQEGSYLISGTLNDGAVIVDTDTNSKVQLILDGVNIHSQTSAPIYIRQADKVFITLADKSENVLSNGGSFVSIDENNIDSVIFSKDDLTLNGSGSLTVTSPAGHGIVSKDDLRITGGSYAVTAASHGMTANDSVRIAEAGKDGIQAENDEDATLGFVYIADGNFQINASGDGISASATMQLNGGVYNLLCGGGSEYGEEHTDDMFGGGMGGRPGGHGGFWGGIEPTAEEDTTPSAKGLKSTGPMTLSGGPFTINAADDAIHSNNTLTVNSGSFQIASGDDGFHADEALTIRDGSIAITESYEGLEGLTITVSGGAIRLCADDDGLNAAGGNDQSGFGGMGGRPGGHGGFGGDMFGVSSDSYIDISGGNLFVDAAGDGIDSNGNLTISGGYIVVEGPTNGGNGSLDYGGSGSFSGGTILISGSSGMAQSLQTTGNQGIIAVNVGNCPAGTLVTVTDESGSTVLSLQPQKQFGCIILSNPQILKGSSYTISIGSESATFAAS